jgi:hypothetical protein
MKLIFTKEILLQIKDIVYARETASGVSLFGEKQGEDFKILKIAVRREPHQVRFFLKIFNQPVLDILTPELKEYRPLPRQSKDSSHK